MRTRADGYGMPWDRWFRLAFLCVVVVEVVIAVAMLIRIVEIPAVAAMDGVVLPLDPGQGEDASVKTVGLSELTFSSVEDPKVIRLFAKPLPRQGACRICAWSNIPVRIPANSVSGFSRR